MAHHWVDLGGAEGSPIRMIDNRTAMYSNARICPPVSGDVDHLYGARSSFG